jgi:hypothetical protein
VISAFLASELDTVEYRRPEEQVGASRSSSANAGSGPVSPVNASAVSPPAGGFPRWAEVRQRHASQRERPDAVLAGKRMQLEHRGQVNVRFQAREAIQHTGWTVQRDPRAGVPVPPQPEEAVQVDAVIGMLAGDDHRVRPSGQSASNRGDVPYPRSRMIRRSSQSTAQPLHARPSSGKAPQLPSTVSFTIRAACHVRRPLTLTLAASR